MQIIRIDRQGNQIGEDIFSSFREVYDYCLEDLEKQPARELPCKEDVSYGFKILDSNETFSVLGIPLGEDSCVNAAVIRQQ